MQKLSRIAAAAAVFMCVPGGVLLAQNTPNTGPDLGTTPAPTTTPTATQPAATTTPPATTTTTTTKKHTGKTTRQEIDKSIDRGTVPKRYRNDVPKEYQKYIPFEK